MKADSVIRVNICVDQEPVSALGIPPETTMGQLWQIIDEYYPDMVGFPRGYLYARRALDTFDQAHHDSDPVSIWATELVLFVDLLLKSSAIFTVFCVDDERKEAICAHPDLVLGTILDLVTQNDSTSLDFVDPDGVEIDLAGDAVTATIAEYIDLLRSTGYTAESFVFQATSSQTLRFVVHVDTRDYTFDYEDEAQLTTTELLEIVRAGVPSLEGEGYLFCAGGIISYV